MTPQQTRDDYLTEVTIGEPRPHRGPVELGEYDTAWPGLFEREAAHIREALGARALLVEHVGSTSVPGLPAKPVLDIVVAVAESANEASYVPALVAAGYTLRIRERDWFEHRLLKRDDPPVNVHVFSNGCPEIDRMIAFRDRLRVDEADRKLYARTKRELAVRDWEYVQHYADAKGKVIERILERR